MGNTWRTEIFYIILNMFGHYNRIDVLKLRLLEESGAETLVVPYVDIVMCLECIHMGIVPSYNHVAIFEQVFRFF